MVQQMAIYDQIIVSFLVRVQNSTVTCFDRTQVGMFSVSYNGSLTNPEQLRRPPSIISAVRRQPNINTAIVKVA